MNITIGILAPVDAGKTTLSEQLLFKSGSIRTPGRVDHGSSFLDTDELERSRGITIYSSEAKFSLDTPEGIIDFTLLDTPGHTDFSAEMERTLSVLDNCILVINGSDMVNGYVKVLWKLIQKHNIPTIIFINKIDLCDSSVEALITLLQKDLTPKCYPFEPSYYDDIALLDEELMEKYLTNGRLSNRDIRELYNNCKFIPVFSGSALKDIGIDDLISGIAALTLTDPVIDAEENPLSEANNDPSLKRQKNTSAINNPSVKSNSNVSSVVFKISRDPKGTRLTHMKILSGKLRVKDIYNEEKIDQIRLYNGAGYELVNEALPGQICAVTGLSNSSVEMIPSMLPVMTYEMLTPENINLHEFCHNLSFLSEESPEIEFAFPTNTKPGIQVKVMGEIQLEVLKDTILNRFGISVKFGPGQVFYKETISEPVTGIGHYEPLKHYAHTQILISPLHPGSGIEIESILSEDILDRNYQRLIMTHLGEKKHAGILTGSELTDVKYTLTGGKAHLKHTEGGDFREATYRAVRQALRKSDKNILLEPVYSFELVVPVNLMGRALKDIELKGGNCNDPVVENETALITGLVPVSETTDYQREVLSYTKGTGRFTPVFYGYLPCHNTAEVLKRINYDPDSDTENPCGSVFCSHGAGYYVPWDEVDELSVGIV